MTEDKKDMACCSYDSNVFGMFATLYLSEGAEGDVLRIEAKKRTGEQNYTDAIAVALKKFPGVGGSK